MPYETRADFDAGYRMQADSLIGGRAPGDPPVFIHYHYAARAPALERMWSTIAPILNIPTDSAMMIVGAGFGWGVEAAIAATGVANTIGIDTSAYIQAEKDNTEEAELREAIVAAGLDPDTGRGAVVLAALMAKRPGTRAGTTIVLDEDAQTNTSRQAIRAALGAWPDVCVVEDLIDEDTTAQQISQINSALDNFAGTQRIIWILSPLVAWSYSDVATLTGAEVISKDGAVYLNG